MSLARTFSQGLKSVSNKSCYSFFPREDSTHLLEQGTPICCAQFSRQFALQGLCLTERYAKTLAQSEFPLCLHSLSVVAQSTGLVQELLIIPKQQNIAQPDDDHVQRGIDEAIDLIHRLAIVLPLGFRQIHDDLEPCH